MIDGWMRRRIGRPLDRAGARLSAAGFSADRMTLLGAFAGVVSAGAIAAGYPLAGAALFLISRLADGLDGAIARATAPTDRGGFLDIVLDFVVYAAIPLAFAVADPVRNALPAAVLLASFLVNGATFLAFAVMAERRRLETKAQGIKSLYYLTGLAEGTETIAVFVACCLFPSAFPLLAQAFAAVCLVSAAARILLGWRLLG